MTSAFGALFFALMLSLSALAQGKNPVILIPGLSGSELRQKGSNDRIWFKTFRSRSEDLRLPIVADPTKTRDSLIATDVLRNVKIGPFPVTDVYGGFIKAMETQGGYYEETWVAPSSTAYKDSLFVFPYDWRLDNVGNAKLLIRKIEALKRTLKKPDLKFDIVAHSMGGIISRYAAMYGDADLPAGNKKPVVTWAGAKHFDNIILLGVPNEGSAMALGNIANGFTLGGLRIDLPFAQDTSKFTVFTIPSGYQLLPAPGSFRAFNEKLEPIEVDIYDPKVWAKYGWSPFDDKKYTKEFSSAERKAAPIFLAASLARAKKLHEALAASKGNSGGVNFHLVGSDCRQALDAILIYFDKKDNKWQTVFKPKGFSIENGIKITDDELKVLLQFTGDGVVTTRSLLGEMVITGDSPVSVLNNQPAKYFCEEHNKLAANSKVQEYIISVFAKAPTSERTSEDK